MRVATDAYCALALIRLNNRFKAMPGSRELGGTLTTRVVRRTSREPTSPGPAIHTEAPNASYTPEETMPEVANPSLRRGVLTGGGSFGFDSGMAAGTDPFGATGGRTGGAGPGANACTLIGLSPDCTWAEAILAGIDVLGGGGNGNGSAPGLDAGSGPCPGPLSVYDPISGRCVNITDAAPGGDPLFSAPTGEAVKGMYGAGFRPMQETITRRKCPRGTVLGDDGVCYKGLSRSRRMWDPGMKPLLTGGDRAAIRRAERAAKKLKRAKKSIKASARALERVC